jgi:elongation factor 1-alpha
MALVACKFADFIQGTGREQEEKVTKAHEWIQKDDVSIVNLVLSKPLVIKTFQEYAATGRFAVRDMKHTLAFGVVRAVEKKQVEAKNGK